MTNLDFLHRVKRYMAVFFSRYLFQKIIMFGYFSSTCSSFNNIFKRYTDCNHNLLLLVLKFQNRFINSKFHNRSCLAKLMEHLEGNILVTLLSTSNKLISQDKNWVFSEAVAFSSGHLISFFMIIPGNW